MPVALPRSMILVAAVLAALVLQSAVLRWFLPNWLIPNFMVMIVVLLAFRKPTATGVVIAFLLGIVLDASSGQLIGPWGGAFAVVFGFLASVSQRLFIQAPVAVGFTTAASTLVSSFIFVVITHEFKGVSTAAVTDIIGEAITTGLLAPIVIGLAEQLLPFDRESASYGRRRRSGRR